MGMIYIGADHRGFELKAKLLDWLKLNGYNTVDCGAFVYDPNDDYPEFAEEVAEKVSEEESNRGVVICGSGVGVDIVANKVEGIRCGLGFDTEQVKKTREDDDINILAISADSTPEEKTIELIRVFLETKFKSTPSHERRIEEISNLD